MTLTVTSSWRCGRIGDCRQRIRSQPTTPKCRSVRPGSRSLRSVRFPDALGTEPSCRFIAGNRYPSRRRKATSRDACPGLCPVTPAGGGLIADRWATSAHGYPVRARPRGSVEILALRRSSCPTAIQLVLPDKKRRRACNSIGRPGSARHGPHSVRSGTLCHRPCCI